MPRPAKSPETRRWQHPPRCSENFSLFLSAEDRQNQGETPYRLGFMGNYDFSSHRLCVDSALAAGARVLLGREQANYLLNVLRLGEGAGLLVFNGRDGEWQARIHGGTRKAPELAIERQTRPQPPANDLWYLFAPIKSARLDYMVQKAVEMGAGQLHPVITRRTVPSRVNLERMRANAVEAAEQCGILHVPEVAGDMPLAKVLDHWPAGRRLIFCDEDAPVADSLVALKTITRGAPLAVLIGPEGGFDPAERQQMLQMPNVLPISLGPRILRADTAAIAALTLVQAVLGDLS